MAPQRFAILDPAAGISGDMLLGALVDAGCPEDWLRGLPARLGLPDVEVRLRRVTRCGLSAVKADVVLPGGRMEHPHDVPEAVAAGAGEHHHHHHHHGPGEHHHDEAAAHGQRHAHAHEPGHQHAHGGGHGHRRIGELIALVERAPLSAWVRERAVRAFTLLAEAEGRVHGQRPDEVVLHEVGAADAVVDIVGGIEGFERLGISRVHARPTALGSGWVRAAHGVLPVPAPATAYLLEGIPVREGGPVRGEATTPTGAVLLRVLSEGPAPDRWRAVGGGWGAGGRDPGEYPNALRLILAESVPEAGEVVVLASDLDDLAPEYLEPLREALLAAGALDVQCWATQAKKGRTGFRIEVTAAPAEADRVGDALLRESPTAGYRWWRAERRTLARREIRLDVGDGISVRVKVLEGPGGIRAKPEFDDVARLAARTGRPAFEVARELQNMALRQLGTAPGAGAGSDNQES